MTRIKELTATEVALLEKHTADAPVSVSKLASSLGLPIRLATLKPGISGEIRPNADTPSGFVIRVNRHESKGRQRFTAAHEVAHYLLHRELIQGGISDSVLYRSELSNTIEAQANGLAANILMPKELVLRIAKSLGDLTEDDLVEQLAERFAVSTAAMRIRLGVE